MTNSFNIEQLNNLSDKEKEYVLNILKELSQDGNSNTYNKLLYEDYSEIPVDIETFLHDSQYLGRALTDEDGRFTVYPYWEKVLKDIFPNNIDTNFNTAIFTGAIGLGKSTIAVIAVLYQLYRMMCLKNPYTHYGIQEIDTITFAFMNITLDAAGGVAWNKCQNMLQMSPWFMERGSLTKSKDPEWVPPSGIELLIGSKPSHIIGRAVFACLDGDTIIKTTEGDFPISSLVDKPIIVPTLSDDGIIVNSDICTVKPTISTVEQYELELEDGTIIKCTPNHRFLLTNGEYKEAQDLTAEDDIVEFNPYGYVYKTTNKLNGKFYVGQHKGCKKDESYLGSGILIQRQIKKYGKDNFICEIIGFASDRESLNTLETNTILESIDNPLCINIKKGAVGGYNLLGTSRNYIGIHKDNLIKYIPPNTPIPEGWVKGILPRIPITDGINNSSINVDEELPEGWHKGITRRAGNQGYLDSWTLERRHEMSLRVRGKNNPNYGKGCFGEKNGMYGKPCPEHVKQASSLANKGKKYSDEINKSKGRPGRKKPEGFGDKLSKACKGKKACNNGQINTWIMPGEEIPEGFVEGWIKR